jgi:hypothetical protein
MFQFIDAFLNDAGVFLVTVSLALPAAAIATAVIFNLVRGRL